MFEVRKIQAALDADEYVVNVYPELDSPRAVPLLCAYNWKLAQLNLWAAYFWFLLMAIPVIVGAKEHLFVDSLWLDAVMVLTGFSVHVLFSILNKKDFIPSLSIYSASLLTDFTETDLLALTRKYGQMVDSMTYRITGQGIIEIKNALQENLDRRKK